MTPDRRGPAVAMARPSSAGRSLAGQIGSFAAIGIASTIVYAVLYAALRGMASPLLANALALVITAIGNTAANRRLTFGIRGRRSLLRDHAAGLAAFGIALAITSVAAGLLSTLGTGAGRPLELAVLIAASGMATVVRFTLLRSWIAGLGPGRIGRAADTFVGSPS